MGKGAHIAIGTAVFWPAHNEKGPQRENDKKYCGGHIGRENVLSSVSLCRQAESAVATKNQFGGKRLCGPPLVL